MTERYLIGDLHMSHKGIVKFDAKNGKKERPWDTTEEMDEALIKNWNKTVGTKDKIYVLGDFCINRSALPILGRLNGIKRLIKGNHDVFRLDEYAPYFKDVHGSYPLEEFVLTHIPIHPMELFPTGRWKGNLHGHLHSARVMKVHYDNSWYGMTAKIDPKYLCLSAEQINYTPINFEEAKLMWEKQQ